MSTLPILYSFRRCPYAMRARMALFLSGIRVELREVELKSKPQALREISPKATVPVLLLTDGTVLEQSLEIMEWALTQHDPGGWLYPHHSREPSRTLISQNDGYFKQSLDAYKYPSRTPGGEPLPARASGEVFLAVLEQHLHLHAHLIGEAPSLVDLAICPFVRQFAGVDPSWWQSSAFPRLRAWLETHTSSPLFAQIMTKCPVWQPGAAPTFLPERRA